MFPPVQMIATIRPVNRLIGRAVGADPSRCRISWLEFVAAQDFLDAQDVCRGSDALVDGEGLPQVAGCFAGVAVLEVDLPEPFQGACLLGRGVDGVCDGERLPVVAAGCAGVCGADG